MPNPSDQIVILSSPESYDDWAIEHARGLPRQNPHSQFNNPLKREDDEIDPLEVIHAGIVLAAILIGLANVIGLIS